MWTVSQVLLKHLQLTKLVTNSKQGIELIKLICTKLIHPDSLEQFHHKPMGLYSDSVPLFCPFMWQLRGTTSMQSYRFVMTLLK